MKFKIVISKIEEKEVPETAYTNTNEKDEKGNEIWKYVDTGRTKIEREEKEIYFQELEELDVKDLTTYINRVE